MHGLLVEGNRKKQTRDPTPDRATVWPTLEEIGYPSESHAFSLQPGYDVGVMPWAKPVISSLFSMEDPAEIKEDKVLVLETYVDSGNETVQIEERVAVRREGYRLLTKFPSE